MMDQIAMTIGYFVIICGLGALVFGVLSFVAYLILLAWEAFSYRFRATLKAEKTILEFRKNREKFLEWKEQNDGN
jgi:hypothetical protein